MIDANTYKSTILIKCNYVYASVDSLYPSSKKAENTFRIDWIFDIKHISKSEFVQSHIILAARNIDFTD